MKLPSIPLTKSNGAKLSAAVIGGGNHRPTDFAVGGSYHLPSALMPPPLGIQGFHHDYGIVRQ